MKKFKVQSIAKVEHGGVLRGPMSPMYTVKEFFKKLDTKLHGIMRVSQQEATTLNLHNYDDEPEAYIDLLIGIKFYKDDYVCVLILDEGWQAIAISMFSKDEVYDPAISPEYLQRPMGEHLTKEDIDVIRECVNGIEISMREQIQKALN